MADNVTIPASGTGTATPAIATDDVSSAHYQKIKVDGGGDGLSVPIIAGQQLAAGSLPVVLTAIQVAALTPPTTATATATLANVASSASSVTLQASNAARKAWAVYNDSTAILYVKFGATASTTSYTVQMTAGSYYEMPFPVYTGLIAGIWASATGAARVTEL